MPAQIVVRPATNADAPALAELLRELGWFAFLNDLGPEAAREHVARQLALDLAEPSHLVLVALDGEGAVAGYAAVHWLPYLFKAGREAYVSELFVGEKARGRGLGSALLAAIEREARARGCSQLMLVQNRQRQAYARGFYAGRGWQERADMANFCRLL